MNQRQLLRAPEDVRFFETQRADAIDRFNRDPDAAATMMQALGSDDWTWPSDIAAALTYLPAGHGFSVPENLFRKITDEERIDWQTRFAGVRT